MEAHHTRSSHEHGRVEIAMKRPSLNSEDVRPCLLGEQAFAPTILKRTAVIVTAHWLIGALLLFPHAAVGHAQELVGRARELPRIEAGTLVSTDAAAGKDAGRWNRVVLLARPRIASGDVGSLSSAIRNSVSDFVLTILASVEEFQDPVAGEPRFRLVDIGVGYSTQVGGEMRAVTVADADKVGVKLGLFSRMLLAENEKKLATATITARTSTLMIVDTPAVVLRDNEHHEFVMRHFIWVEPTTGRNAALVWLIDHDQAGNPVVDQNEPPRWAPAGLQEDRAIHVDGKEFNLIGIPNERAFAIEDLPPGKPIPWTPEARALAAKPSYQAEELRKLSFALNAMLQSSRETPSNN
jgi:hypothetical protein